MWELDAQYFGSNLHVNDSQLITALAFVEYVGCFFFKYNELTIGFLEYGV